MSARQCFAFCVDCWELNYGIVDSNGVYTRDSASSNHWDHAVHTFGDPDDYSPPIRGVLRSLHRGEVISDARMTLFSLAVAVEALQPNNGIKVDSPRAQAADTWVKGKQPSGTMPRRRPAAAQDETANLPSLLDQDTLFGGVT